MSATAAGAASCRVSVVVPTLRRPGQLLQCLEGIRRQRRRPHEVVVVRREDDQETAAALRTHADPLVLEVTVGEPGVVAALRRGASRSSGEIIVMTDDDAVPRRDWLERLLAPYADPTVGAVGGRDVVHHGDEVETGSQLVVGTVSSFGRVIGGNHLGAGVLREVDHLKGVNMSFRRSALYFPSGLRGTGAQIPNELAPCLRAKLDGWRVLYEPSALVDHFPGPRFDEDARSGPSRQAQANTAFNQAYTLLSLRPDRRARCLAWALLIGNRTSPGLLRSLEAAVRSERDVLSWAPGAIRANLEAWRAARAHPMVLHPVDAGAGP